MQSFSALTVYVVGGSEKKTVERCDGRHRHDRIKEAMGRQRKRKQQQLRKEVWIKGKEGQVEGKVTFTKE